MYKSLYNITMEEHLKLDRPPTVAALSDARERLSEIVDDVALTGGDFVITKHGKPTAVLMGFDEYENLIETLNILSDSEAVVAIREAEADLAAGELVEMD